MARPIFLIDVDGVLADFIAQYLIASKRALGLDEEPVRPAVHNWNVIEKLGQSQAEQGKVWDELIHGSYEHVSWMPVIEGAKKALHRLNQMGDIFFLTSPVHKGNWMQHRVEWLQRHFGFVTYEEDFSNRVIFCSGKYKYLVDGAIFIDDKESTVRDWADAHPTSLAHHVQTEVPKWDLINRTVEDHLRQP